MLTRYGFTTVFDTASDQANTLALRERIARGEIRGPRILTVGFPLFPPDGIPFYIRDLPPERLPRTSRAARPRHARTFARISRPAQTGPNFPAHLARQEESAFHVGRSARAAGKRRTRRANSCSPIPPVWKVFGAHWTRAWTSWFTPRWEKNRRGTQPLRRRDDREAHVGRSRRSSSGGTSCSRTGLRRKSSTTGQRHIRRTERLQAGGRPGPVRHRRGLHA